MPGRGSPAAPVGKHAPAGNRYQWVMICRMVTDPVTLASTAERWTLPPGRIGYGPGSVILWSSGSTPFAQPVRQRRARSHGSAGPRILGAQSSPSRVPDPRPRRGTCRPVSPPLPPAPALRVPPCRCPSLHRASVHSWYPARGRVPLQSSRWALAGWRCVRPRGVMLRHPSEVS